MKLYYFNDERTGYCEGTREDQEKYNPNALFVERRPGPEYWYNFDKNEWEMTEALFRECHEERLISFLRDTSWLLNSEDTPLSAQEKQTLLDIRNESIHFFEGDFLSKTLPIFPQFIKKWIKDEESL